MKPLVVFISSNGYPFDPVVEKLSARGVGCTLFEKGIAAIDFVGRRIPDLVILDAATDSTPQVLAGLERIKACWPNASLILITQKRSESLAVGALKAGVADYFRPPFGPETLSASIEREMSLSADSSCRKKPLQTDIARRLVGGSRIMEELKTHIGRIAMADSTVLITGETGTGKELAARLIHENSARARRSLVSVNCAALPDSLVESELFGYERGAFTGAAATTRGRLEQARGGTVFLDEIGDMTAFAQAKILRVIEDKRIARLGGATPMALDFRLIAATNREPETLMKEGTFRNDLFYRLNVARVHMPNLRDHREDIPLLVEHCIRKLNRGFNRIIEGLTTNAMDAVMQHGWPGNVRELMNLLEAAYINMPVGRIRFVDLPPLFCRYLAESRQLHDEERAKLVAALLETNWNKTTAAKKLNWSRMTLYRKMAKHKVVEKRNR